MFLIALKGLFSFVDRVGRGQKSEARSKKQEVEQEAGSCREARRSLPDGRGTDFRENY